MDFTVNILNQVKKKKASESLSMSACSPQSPQTAQFTPIQFTLTKMKAKSKNAVVFN